MEAVRARQVLVVDDEAFVRIAMAGLFACLGHTVVAAQGGPEALELLRGGLEPDLVVMDLCRPGMDGEEALLRLRRLRHAVPVLLASGAEDERNERILRQYPNVAVVMKPFSLTAIKAKLARLP